MVHETKNTGRTVLQIRKLQAEGRSIAGRVQGIVNGNNRTLRGWLDDATVLGTARSDDASNDYTEQTAARHA
jgi:hypothetical protein